MTAAWKDTSHHDWTGSTASWAAALRATRSDVPSPSGFYCNFYLFSSLRIESRVSSPVSTSALEFSLISCVKWE